MLAPPGARDRSSYGDSTSIGVDRKSPSDSQNDVNAPERIFRLALPADCDVLHQINIIVE